MALRLQEALDTEKAAEEKNGVPAKEEELVMTDEVAGGEELALADEVNEIVKEQKMDTAPAPAKEEEATKEKKEEPAAKIEEHPEYKKELEAFVSLVVLLHSNKSFRKSKRKNASNFWSAIINTQRSHASSFTQAKRPKEENSIAN